MVTAAAELIHISKFVCYTFSPRDLYGLILQGKGSDQQMVAMDFMGSTYCVGSMIDSKENWIGIQSKLEEHGPLLLSIPNLCKDFQDTQTLSQRGNTVGAKLGVKAVNIHW